MPSLRRHGAEVGASWASSKTREAEQWWERFNGRVSSEVLGINIYSHRALEQVLRGFNVAYHPRRQRVLAAKTPNQVVQERLISINSANHSKTNTRSGQCDLTKARLIVEASLLSRVAAAASSPCMA